MSKLVEKLKAAIDADERAIQAYEDHRRNGPCINYEGQDPADYDEHDSCSTHVATAEACRYRTPEAGRAMVAAHREIMAIHRNAGHGLCAGCGLGVTVHQCKVLRALAKGYGIAVPAD